MSAPTITPGMSDPTADLRIGGPAGRPARDRGVVAPDRTGPAAPAAPVAPAAPARPGSGGAVAVTAVAILVVMAGLALAGLHLLPPYAPTYALTAPAASRPAPAPVGRRGPAPAAPAYLCGATSGHRVTVVDGAVPCDQALLVAGQWLAFHATPADGAGGAGTSLSWTCSARPGGGGACTSRAGGAMTIEGRHP